jgi:hypothetical protein
VTTTVFTVPGTGEQSGSVHNVLNWVTLSLDPKRYRLGGDLAYPGSIGPANPSANPFGPAEQQSRDAGVAAIAAAVRACPARVVLGGYSLGAQVISDFLELKAAGQFDDCDIEGVFLLANPSRALDEGIDPDLPGWGINGEHKPWPRDIPVVTGANPADVITCCPPNSPLRVIAQGVDELAAADFTPEQLFDFVIGIRGYLVGGEHTIAYFAGVWCARVATAINAL